MADKHLDVRNEACPRPMIMTMSTIKTLEKGQTLSVETTDKSAKESIPNLCERAGYTLVEMTEENGTFRFTIRK